MFTEPPTTKELQIVTFGKILLKIGEWNLQPSSHIMDITTVQEESKMWDTVQVCLLCLLEFIFKNWRKEVNQVRLKRPG